MDLVYWLLYESAPYFVGLLVIIVFFIILQMHANERIAIKFSKPDFKIGEDITGTVNLGLKKETKANSLKAYLRVYEYLGKDETGRRTGKLLHESSLTLSGAKTFKPGETIPFSFFPPPLDPKYFEEPKLGDNAFDRLAKNLTPFDYPVALIEINLNVENSLGIGTSKSFRIMPRPKTSKQHLPSRSSALK